ncbi:MAG: outer membrane beta-barrel protein [Sphaerochaetaceae bacterium]
MQKKIFLVLVLLLVLSIGATFAATPSTFEIGLLNYYSLSDLAETEFANYTPGLRATLFLKNWFGLSGDALIRAPFTGATPYNLILSGDLVIRWPAGLVEPYIAFGPAYDFVIDEDGVSLPKTIRLGGRLGVDFNITSILSVGVEANHIVSDLSDVIDGGAYDFMGDTFVGITVKAKF